MVVAAVQKKVRAQKLENYHVRARVAVSTSGSKAINMVVAAVHRILSEFECNVQLRCDECKMQSEVDPLSKKGRHVL